MAHYQLRYFLETVVDRGSLDTTVVPMKSGVEVAHVKTIAAGQEESTVPFPHDEELTLLDHALVGCRSS